MRGGMRARLADGFVFSILSRECCAVLVFVARCCAGEGDGTVKGGQVGSGQRRRECKRVVGSFFDFSLKALVGSVWRALAQVGARAVGSSGNLSHLGEGEGLWTGPHPVPLAHAAGGCARAAVLVASGRGSGGFCSSYGASLLRVVLRRRRAPRATKNGCSGFSRGFLRRFFWIVVSRVARRECLG